MIYIATFVISCGLFLLSEYRRFANHFFLKYTIVIFAILIPSLIAGLRDFSVGTDVRLYGNFWFEYAGKMNFLEYAQFGNRCSIGFLYILLNYIVRTFTDDIRVFYFTLSFLETCMIYASLNLISNYTPLSHFNKNNFFKEKKAFSVSFAMFCYYTIFYNNTLNLLRQFLAVSIVCLAFAFIIKKRYLLSMGLLCLAVLSHNSAAFAFILIPLHLLNEKNKSKKSLYILDLTLFITITFIMILYKPFLTFLISRGILSNRFFTYMDNTAVGGRMIRTFFWIFVSVLGCMGFSKIIAYRQYNKFILSCVFISMAFSFVMFMVNVYAIRMAFYFDLASLVFIPTIPQIYKLHYNKKSLKWGMYLVLIILLIFRWYLEYVRSNNGQTYPYKFMQC